MHWEFHFLDLIQQTCQSPFMDWFMPLVSSLADSGFIWIALTIVLLCIPKQRRAGYACAVSLLAMLLLGNLILKPLVGRIRPFTINAAITLLIEAPTDFSFPSGHTFASFACSVALFLENKKLGIPALLLAVLIAFSRLYLYVHYPTDVLGGLLLGICVACAAHWAAARLARG